MDASAIERETMDYDVVIVGAGPAGLCAAIRLKQLAEAKGEEISVAILEKGSEVGAHILSGVVFDPKALDELLPDWRDESSPPFDTPVKQDKFYFLGEHASLLIPGFAMPPLMHNHGCYTGSLANLCRWLAEKAESFGVEIYPGFAGAALVKDENGRVRGVQIGDMGVSREGDAKNGVFTPGINVLGKYTLLGEGVRGSLSKQAIADYTLDAECDVQKYGIGLKELWKVKDAVFEPGLVQHSFGWPLDSSTGGGSFLYHFGDNFVSIGFVVHLNYKNPHLSPYQEFQRFKHHPQIAKVLEGGERIAYGARAITEGGYQSVPKLAFPGGALIGCSAGFVNLPRIKGSHNAMKTGMMAADAAFAAISEGRANDTLEAYQAAYDASWVKAELKRVRNVKPMWSRLGLFGGIMLGGLDMWLTTAMAGWSPFGTLKHGKTDAESLEPAARHKPIAYPKPDGVLSFDRLTNVAYSFTNHEEDQPVHLKVKDLKLQKDSELAVFAGPSQHYCPAGVYEWLPEGDGMRFQINAQNCVHCKTCDIKDPNQNINWTVPEGGGGPNYPNM
jgi:electron-transferring-flavoprotein dehydrogenase